MIEFRTLPDDHPDLAHSPLLRAALLTLQYTHEHGAIGLTKTKAFKRVFVHWAVAHFDWPDSSAEEMFRMRRLRPIDFRVVFSRSVVGTQVYELAGESRTRSL